MIAKAAKHPRNTNISGETSMATLLVIDDDSTVRETLRKVFSQSYECDTADRAEQALKYLEFQDYDAIITDISMPGVGGFQILKHIQARHSKTPVIVISGNGSEFEDLLMEMGAFAYFTKPFRLEKLELAVTQAIAQHQQRFD
jgi:DNA-binding NtrC family response regulator